MKKMVLVFLVLVSSVLSAQNKGDKISNGEYDKIHSEILDEDRIMLINLPENYDNTAIDYPVVYLFYGDRVMQYFSPEGLPLLHLIPSVWWG